MSDAALLAAHAAGDHATLIQLYTAEADSREAAGDVDAACFYLTHAYVFALHAGAAQAHDLNRRLVTHGREAPLPETAP